MALEVGAIGVAVDFYGDGVFAFFEGLGELELSGGAGVLGVADFLAVAPEVEGGGDAVESDCGLAAVPGVGEGEGFEVGGDGVALVEGGEVLGRCAHDEGRLLFEGVGVIAVDGGAVALELDVGGDGDGFPSGGIEVGLEEIGGALVRVVGPVESPVAIENETVGGLETLFGEGSFFGGKGHFDGAGRHFVLAEDGLVFPIGGSVGEGGEGDEEKECAHELLMR